MIMISVCLVNNIIYFYSLFTNTWNLLNDSKQWWCKDIAKI